MNWDEPILNAAATDTGMRRSNNQDSYTIVRASNPETWRQRGHVFIVADGMGAHAVGELASKMACDNIPHHYTKTRTGTPTEAILKAYAAVGAQIHQKATSNLDFQGMGTTCTSLVLLPQGALIAHVGDSRVYRVRDHRIDQLSFDHSLAWELVKRNHISPEEAQRAIPRNVITRSLGPDPTVEVDIEGPLPVLSGDVYLLCSDGLSGPVTDPELGAFASQFHPDDAVRFLLHLANLRGGPDNITVLIVRVGPWHEPGTTSPQTKSPVPTKPRDRLGSRLAGLLGRRSSEPVVEEHLYQSAPCPLDLALLERLNDLVRRAQATAIEQSWTLDWSKLSGFRHQADEARATGNFHRALRGLGEAVVLLGIAGRLHRKLNGSPSVTGRA